MSPRAPEPAAAAIPLVQRVDFLLDSARGRRVLHLGCTNAPYTERSLREGSLLHLRLQEVAAELHGTDIDAGGLGLLARLGVPNLHEGDIEALAPELAARRFDVVIAGEIIEHLANPGRFLAAIARILPSSGRVVVTTINAYCAFRMAQYAFRGRGGRVEPVHPDHVAYYSMTTLCRLVQRGGFEVQRRAFYDLGPEHLVHLRPALRRINALATALAPQLADGLVVEARPGHDVGSAGG